MKGCPNILPSQIDILLSPVFGGEAGRKKKRYYCLKHKKKKTVDEH